MTTTFSIQVAAPALPESLKLPFLTESYLDNQYVEDTVALPSAANDRYSDPGYDHDGGDGMNWNSQFSLDVMNAPYEYQPEDQIDKFEERQSAGNVKQFSRIMAGNRADLIEPLELANGSYAYIDWMECIRYWRSKMTQEQIERIDWSALNPDRYQLKANGSFALITD